MGKPQAAEVASCQIDAVERSPEQGRSVPVWWVRATTGSPGWPFALPRHRPRWVRRPLARFGGPRTKASRGKSPREDAYLGHKELPIACSGAVQGPCDACPPTVRLKARAPGEGATVRRIRAGRGRRVNGLPTTPTTEGIGPRLEAGLIICVVRHESSTEPERWRRGERGCGWR